MITYFQAVILGALQGVTELFPISSLGHSVILPTVFGWHIDQHDNMFVVFLVATHLATALVLLAVFLKDWILIVKGFFRSVTKRSIDRDDTYARLAWLIIVATIPAGIIGLLLQKRLEGLFASPLSAALFLILNGAVLYGAELLKRRDDKKQYTATPDQGIAMMTWWQSAKIGAAQCLALIPGFSRTGSALAGGLLAGLNHEEAARFSFLLATPIIVAAAALKLPHLFHADSGVIGPVIVGAIVSGIAAYAAIRFLTAYFEKHTLAVFARYCIIAGIVFSVLLLV